MKNAWGRLANESDVVFSAFKTYLEMEDRSYSKVAEKLKKSTTIIYRWAKQFDWKSPPLLGIIQFWKKLGKRQNKI